MGRRMTIPWTGNPLQEKKEKPAKPQRTIVQIIAAEGWQAVYAIKPETNQNQPVWVSPLACWALVQEETNRYVVGLDCTLAFCNQGDNFLGYLAPGEKPKKWEDAAIRNLQAYPQLE